MDKVDKNSGTIYLAPLDFNLGFSICKFIDYTDIAPFDGALVYVMNIRVEKKDNIPPIEDVENLSVLFGPVPLNKFPNTRGKGAWKFLGKINLKKAPPPVFKDTNQLITLSKAINWAKVGGWRKRYLHQHDIGTTFDYEDVRDLEMLTLYDMNTIQIRATMHFLILCGKKVEDYYDLNTEKYRRVYLQLLNTSFDKKTAEKYLLPF